MTSHRVQVAAAAALVLCACTGGERPQPARTTTPATLPQHAFTYEVGAGPRAVAVADFDGDGRPDLAVASAGAGTLRLFLGREDGGLQPGNVIQAGREPSDIEAVDLDNDRDIDLVVANHETTRITLLLNDGKATFKASSVETGSRPHVHGLAIADTDGDGWNDVAVESSDGNEVRVFRGGPGGLQPPTAVAVGTMPYFRLGAADLTGDGRAEILVPGHGNDTIMVIGGGRLLEAPRWRIDTPAQPWMVVGDDVNGDRRPDLVAVLTDAVGVWLGDDDGFTPAPGSPFTVPGATEVATGDLDGDGVSDIAVGPWEGSDVVVLSGRTFDRRTISACGRPIGLAVADLDGDARADLVAACATGNRVAVVMHGRSE